ncbi:uncharacterized protein METZ01_LOCUS335499 [marine metagenome]|uniref:Fe2OG dioxygenase domain-containing protein n=1 Tax=marine metagenome TaxID=408172 RepID=A0A382QCM9_9ZZZZ
MSMHYFDTDSESKPIVEALLQDGAAIISNQVSDDLTDRVKAELRDSFDSIGRYDEGDFNGYRTLRVSSILAVSRSSSDLVAHQRVIDVADAILLNHCASYQIGSLTGIEILPGETDQWLHTDDSIYPIQLAGMELQISALWALDDFGATNGATRVVLGSHRQHANQRYYETLEDFRRLNPGVSDDNIVQATMPKGSLLLYLGKTLHGGCANHADSTRMALVNTYSLGWLRQEENQYLNVPREQAEQYPRIIQDLMGYKPHRGLGTYQRPDGKWVEYDPL